MLTLIPSNTGLSYCFSRLSLHCAAAPAGGGKTTLQHCKGVICFRRLINAEPLPLQVEAAAPHNCGSWLSRLPVLLRCLSRLTTAAALLLQVEAAALQRILDALDQNKPARAVELNDDEAAAVKSLYLLTMKPLIYAANVAEDMLADLGATDKHVQVGAEPLCSK